jgi:hypothetical protein
MIDTLKIARRLASAGADPKLANAIADEIGEVSTAPDLSHLVTRDELRSELAQLEQRLVIKLGAMMAVGLGAVATLVALF